MPKTTEISQEAILIKKIDKELNLTIEKAQEKLNALKA